MIFIYAPENQRLSGRQKRVARYGLKTSRRPRLAISVCLMRIPVKPKRRASILSTEREGGLKLLEIQSDFATVAGK
jgi:hypothetical protein